jgi:hypothetical protein
LGWDDIVKRLMMQVARQTAGNVKGTELRKNIKATREGRKTEKKEMTEKNVE